MQPVESEEMWPVSPNPRPVPPEYVRLPGKEKKKEGLKTMIGEEKKLSNLRGRK